MEQAPFRSDDEWTPTIGPRKAAHKATISKQIARARATTKLDAGHSANPALERLACIQIPSNTRSSGPSSGRTQRLLHIDIKTNIKATVTQARIDAKGNSAFNADISATDIVPTTEFDNYEVGTSTSSIHRGTIDFSTLAIPTSAVDNTKFGLFDVHTFETVTKSNDQILGRPSSREDDVLIDIKPNFPDAHSINSVRKPAGKVIIGSLQDLYSSPPTPSPHPSATGGSDEDLLPRYADQDDANKVNSSSVVDSATKTDISPAYVSAIESSHAHDDGSQHGADVGRGTISGSSVPEELETTLDDNDYIRSDLLKDLTDSNINPSTSEQTHLQSLAVAFVCTSSIDANNSNNPLDASHSRTGHLDDTLNAPLTNRRSLVSAADAITVDISEVDTQRTEVDPLYVSAGDSQDNQMTSQAARTTSAAPSSQAVPQSTIVLLSEPNTTKPGLRDPLTDPHSKYATGDINNVISFEAYSQFPAKTQRAFVDHLPVCIQNNPRYLDSNTGTANEAFFSMLSFNRAKLDWQKALMEGKFTDEYKTKVAALRREDDSREMATSAIRKTTATATTMMEGRRGETWKSDDFERFYGEKAIQASARKMEAGGSSKTSLAKICLNKGIQIGDLLLYVREFTVKPLPQQQPSPRRKSNGNVAATTTSTAVITTTAKAAAVLSTEVVPGEQTARCRWIARLSRMAMIDKRDNKDKVLTSSRAGRTKVDQLMQVLDITKSGRPIIGFIDGGGCSNCKDHKSTGSEWSKPSAAATTATTVTATTITTTTALSAPAVAKASPRKSEKGQQLQQLQLHSPAGATKLTGVYEIDSALMIERICLERDGQVPKAYRKNAFESWKHIHTFRPIGRDLKDQERVQLEEGDGEVEVVYVGSLFSMRMDIYNHLQSENAKKQVLLEDAAITD